jgi:hypothetical protein
MGVRARGVGGWVAVGRRVPGGLPSPPIDVGAMRNGESRHLPRFVFDQVDDAISGDV